jgi:hypothetical protein
MTTKTIQIFPADKVGRVDIQPDGQVLVTVVDANEYELGFLLPPFAADELTGALIERPTSAQRNRPQEPGRSSRSEDDDCSVARIEELPPEGEKFVIRLETEEGSGVTFRLGDRMVRRWRDLLTAQIVRHQRTQQN